MQQENTRQPLPLTRSTMDALSKDKDGSWFIRATALSKIQKQFEDAVARGSAVAIPQMQELAGFAMCFEQQETGSTRAVEQILGVLNSLSEVLDRLGIKAEQKPDPVKMASQFLGQVPVKLPTEEQPDSNIETFKPWARRN